MTFTTENQKENRISRTTNQTIKHFIYSNIEVSIIGLNNIHKVWVNNGSKIKCIKEDLTLTQAVEEANKAINKY